MGLAALKTIMTQNSAISVEARKSKGAQRYSAETNRKYQSCGLSARDTTSSSSQFTQRMLASL